MQYIPKDAKGTIEDAVNSLALRNQQVNRKINGGLSDEEDAKGQGSALGSEIMQQREAFWRGLSSRVATKKC